MRCDGAVAAKLLDIPTRHWQVACWRVEDGREVIAAVPLPPLLSGSALWKPSPPGAKKEKAKAKDKDKAKEKDKDKDKDSEPAAKGDAAPLVVRLGLIKDQAVLWRGELRPEGKESSELRELLDKSDEWLVGIDDQTLGRARGVRVGVVGHWGGEMMSVRELALLFSLPSDGGAMRLVWSGLGNTRESRLEYCLIEGIATFQLVDDKTLERQMHVTSNVNREIKVPRARARELEKKCVAKPQDPQRFPVSL
jgi:hypothetical protein